MSRAAWAAAKGHRCERRRAGYWTRRLAGNRGPLRYASAPSGRTTRVSILRNRVTRLPLLSVVLYAYIAAASAPVEAVRWHSTATSLARPAGQQGTGANGQG